jgi:hypothetical protein
MFFLHRYQIMILNRFLTYYGSINREGQFLCYCWRGLLKEDYWPSHWTSKTQKFLWRYHYSLSLMLENTWMKPTLLSTLLFPEYSKSYRTHKRGLQVDKTEWFFSLRCFVENIAVLTLVLTVLASPFLFSFLKVYSSNRRDWLVGKGKFFKRCFLSLLLMRFLINFLFVKRSILIAVKVLGLCAQKNLQ